MNTGWAKSSTILFQSQFWGYCSECSDLGWLLLSASICDVLIHSLWWFLLRDNSYTFCDVGNHGYDNEFKSMEVRWFLFKSCVFSWRKSECGRWTRRIYSSFSIVIFLTCHPDIQTVNMYRVHILVLPFISVYKSSFFGIL